MHMHFNIFDAYFLVLFEKLSKQTDMFICMNVFGLGGPGHFYRPIINLLWMKRSLKIDWKILDFKT